MENVKNLTDSQINQILDEENKINAKEFNKDIEEYLDREGTIVGFNTTRESLINYYYTCLIKNPKTWMVISYINNPTPENSQELLFDIINKLKESDYNFERSYFKLRINE